MASDHPDEQGCSRCGTRGVDLSKDEALCIYCYTGESGPHQSMDSNMTTDRNRVAGAVVGRFQIDELHPGHDYLLHVLQTQHAEHAVFLGISALKGSPEDPLDFEARRPMIMDKCPQAIIGAIHDTRSDLVWSAQLDRQIQQIFGADTQVILYGSRASFISHYHGKYPCVEVEQQGDYSATKRREEIAAAGVENDPAFRRGIIKASVDRHINATPTVDLAILDPTETMILLARKPDEKEYRFPGGHVDAGEDFEQAARREGLEETDLTLGELQYAGTMVVDDWRHRGKRSKISTILYATSDVTGMPRAKDDVCELQWMPIKTDLVDQVVSEHIPLVNALIKHLRNQ